MGNPMDVSPRTPTSARPAGVTAAAVACLVGSGLALVVAGFTVLSSFGSLPTVPAGMTQPPANFGSVLRGAGLLLGIFGALGLSTGMGLLRLRPWARVSILVFAGVMVAMCLGGVFVLLALPFPAQPVGPGVPSFDKLRPLVLGVYSVPIAVGVWWLVQFNRARTRAAFGEGPGADAGMPLVDGRVRPLSISIIGGWLVVSGALSVVPAFSGLPAMMFGVMLTGWWATLLYVVIAAVQISAGSGLLKLHETARLLSIAWIVIGIANLAVTAWVPGVGATMETYQRAIGTLPPGQPPFDIMQFMRRMTPLWIVGGAIPLWFLIRRRSAFHGRDEA